MKKFFYLIILLSLSIISGNFTGCSDDTNPVAPGGPNVTGLTLVGEEYAIGGRAKVMMYTDDTLRTGYNKIYLVLYDSVTNNLITDAHIEFAPANHGVTAPVENPGQLAVDGRFTGAVVFTDPTTTDDPRHWHFHVHVHNHQAPNEPEGEAEFSGFTIVDSPDRFFKFQPDSTITYTFALITPVNLSAGLSDIEFLVSTQVGIVYEPFPWFNFDSIAVSGNGQLSTGNILPAPTGNGHYKGKVNLPQAGDWGIFMRFQHHNGTDPIYAQSIFTLHALNF